MYPAAMSLVPSAEQAMELMAPSGKLEAVQVAPEFVERLI
jgi:hypothetical protein